MLAHCPCCTHYFYLALCFAKIHKAFSLFLCVLPLALPKGARRQQKQWKVALARRAGAAPKLPNIWAPSLVHSTTFHLFALGFIPCPPARAFVLFPASEVFFQTSPFPSLPLLVLTECLASLTPAPSSDVDLPLEGLQSPLTRL